MTRILSIHKFKESFANASFRNKLILFTVIQSFIVLSLVTFAFVFNELIVKQNEINNELKTYAEIIAQNATAPLLFNDPKAANETLKGFEDHKQVISVYILNAHNEIFASYKGKPVSGGPAIKSPEQLSKGTEMKNSWLFPAVFERDSAYSLQIMDEGRNIGLVLIQADLREFWERVRQVSIIAFIVFISAMFLTFGMSRRFERIISEPLIKLTESMESVSRNQIFSIRVSPPSYNDEISSLIIGFNNMLANIEQRDTQLADYSRSLEDKIIDRTTELSTANTQLQESIRELEIAKKIAEEANIAKTSFLANMSHEIRTPMNGIMGMTELLLQSTLSEKQKHYATTVKNSTTSLLTIINDILDFSKIEAGKLVLEVIPFNILELLKEIQNNFEPLASQKQIIFETFFYGDLPAVLEGDPVRLRQILVNLLGNAFKFTDNGKVTITITTPAEYQNNGMINISVKDSGIGISQDQLSNIFDRFSQADNSTTRKFGGTGLGLSIVKQLVELMNGNISIESSIGHGSTFTVNICLRASSEQTSLINKFSFQNDDARQILYGTKVLVVEDTAVNQDVCTEILAILGCNITCVENGQIALDVLMNNRFDIILMDCQMPVMDGYECTRLFREWERNNRQKNERTPVVALTGNAMEQDRQQCLECGMDDIILKPFQFQQFITQISFSLSNSSLIQKSAPCGKITQQFNSPENLNLNYEQLNQIRSLERNGEEKVLKKFVLRYIKDAPKLVEDIKFGWYSKDLEFLLTAIHKLKTSSGMMGAEKLSQLCVVTEKIMRTENRLPDIETIAEIENLCEQYNILLKQEITV